MKIQLNNGVINDLPSTAIVATGVGDIEVENLPENPFDHDYIDGTFVRARWSNWHENTKFQIKLTPLQNAYMNSLAPYMAQLTSTFIMHDDLSFIYFYVDEIEEEDVFTIEFFGGEVNNIIKE